MDWRKNYDNKLVSFENAASLVKSGDVIGMSCATSCPSNILDAIAKRYKELEDVTIISGLMVPPVEALDTNHLEAKYIGHINHVSLFLGSYERKFLKTGNVIWRFSSFLKWKPFSQSSSHATSQ